MKSRKTKLILLSLLFFSNISFSQTEENKPIIDGVAVIVADNIILKSELAQIVNVTAMQQNINATQNLELYQRLQTQVLQSLIDQKVVLELAKKDTNIIIKDKEVDAASCCKRYELPRKTRVANGERSARNDYSRSEHDRALHGVRGSLRVRSFSRFTIACAEKNMKDCKGEEQHGDRFGHCGDPQHETGYDEPERAGRFVPRYDKCDKEEIQENEDRCRNEHSFVEDERKIEGRSRSRDQRRGR